MNVALLSQPQRELRAYLQRVAGDGGIVETPGEASTFVRRLRSAGVLGSTVIAGVAGGVKAGTLYSIIGPDLDVTRGTVKNRVNRAGVLSEVASGVPATDFAGGVLRGTTVEPSSRNEIRNNTMQGAVVGSPGTLPTNWVQSAGQLAGLNAQILDISTVDGVESITIRYHGTANATPLQINAEGTTAIVASPNQIWTHSVWFCVVAEPLPPLAYSILSISRRANSTTAGQTSIVITDNKDQFIRRSVPAITIPSDGVAIQPEVLRASLTSGASYDFTVRIGLPQMELGSVATSVIKTTGSAQTRNADVITKTGLGSVLPQTEGWVYAEVDFRALSSSRQILMLSDNSDVNRFSISVNPSNLYLCNFRFNSTSNDTTGGIPPTGKNKMLIYFSFGSVGKLFLNGLLVNTNSIGTPTNAITKLNLGSFYLDTAGFFNDPIHSYAIGSGAITDAQAIQLTTL
jgi:hypothetical protein